MLNTICFVSASNQMNGLSNLAKCIKSMNLPLVSVSNLDTGTETRLWG